MPRYGDLDALEKKLFPMGMVDDGRYALPAKAVKVAIDRLPEADVVPRTVIAEIFADIDRLLAINFCSCLPSGATEHYNYFEGDLADDVAEIKKKYTEVQNI